MRGMGEEIYLDAMVGAWARGEERGGDGEVAFTVDGGGIDAK